MPNYSKTNAKKLMSSMFGSFLAILPIACGPDVQKSAPTKHEGIEGLRILYEERLEAYEFATTDRSGWPSHSDCDGLLFASLASYSGATVDLTLAEYAPGEWHRRPAPSCWTEELGDQGSKSTISNDMLLGLMLGIWAEKDVKAAQRLAVFGEFNTWVMGYPFPEMASRVLLKPHQVGLLGKAIEKLTNGQDLRSYRKLPTLYTPVLEDYEVHLQTIGILFHGELDDAVFALDVSNGMFERLTENTNKNPGDGFLAAVWGLYSGDSNPAFELLLDPNYKCPSYARSQNQETQAMYCEVHWLLAAKIVLDHLGEF